MFKGKLFRKFAAIVICVSMLASLAACGGAKDENIDGNGFEEDVTVRLWYTAALYSV